VGFEKFKSINLWASDGMETEFDIVGYLEPLATADIPYDLECNTCKSILSDDEMALETCDTCQVWFRLLTCIILNYCPMKQIKYCSKIELHLLHFQRSECQLHSCTANCQALLYCSILLFTKSHCSIKLIAADFICFKHSGRCGQHAHGELQHAMCHPH